MEQSRLTNDAAQNPTQCHSQHGGGVKHILMMLLCCLTPLVLAVILPLFGYTGVANFMLLLLCPLLHLVMMRGMAKQSHTESSEKKQ